MYFLPTKYIPTSTMDTLRTLLYLRRSWNSFQWLRVMNKGISSDPIEAQCPTSPYFQ